jgi:hypothetical protein
MAERAGFRMRFDRFFTVFTQVVTHRFTAETEWWENHSSQTSGDSVSDVSHEMLLFENGFFTKNKKRIFPRENSCIIV